MSAEVGYTFQVRLYADGARRGYGVTEAEAREDVRVSYPEVVSVGEVIIERQSIEDE